MEIEERRGEPRARLKASISFYPFTSRPGDTFSGQALNCSPSGMCFQSPHPLVPNQCICIHTLEPSGSGAAHARRQALKTFTMAQVRWCASLGKESPQGFCIGVKYL